MKRAVRTERIRLPLGLWSSCKTLQMIGGPTMSFVLSHGSLSRVIAELEPVIIDGQLPELESQLMWLSSRRGTL